MTVAMLFTEYSLISIYTTSGGFIQCDYPPTYSMRIIIVGFVAVWRTLFATFLHHKIVKTWKHCVCEKALFLPFFLSFSLSLSLKSNQVYLYSLASQIYNNKPILTKPKAP